MSLPPLPRRIRLRRQELRLPVYRAAEIAGVHRATWTMWEAGQQSPSSENNAKIEHALGWEPGEVDAILDGKRDYLDPLTGRTYTDPDEQALWDLRIDLGRRYRATHGEERARELGEARARELIAYLRARTAMEPAAAAEPSVAQVA